MNKIKGYIDRFFEHKKINDGYDMLVSEWQTLSKEARQQTKTADIISVTFSFGYAKGYRAALAEMKKGGAVPCR